MLDIVLTPARHIGLRQVFLRIEVDLIFFGAVFRPLARRVPFLLDRPTRDVPLQDKLACKEKNRSGEGAALGGKSFLFLPKVEGSPACRAPSPMSNPRP